MVLMLLTVDPAPDLPFDMIFFFVSANKAEILSKAVYLPLPVLKENVVVTEFAAVPFWMRVHSKYSCLLWILDYCCSFQECVVTAQANANVGFGGIGLFNIHFRFDCDVEACIF
jgi:hypothetical protein